MEILRGVVLKKLLGIIFAAALFCGASGFLFASDASSAAYLEACKAFSRGEWESAELLLRKAVAYPQNNNADTNYMLITAEIYADDSIRALKDTEAFLHNYPGSIYTPRIQYMRGKLLYNTGDYEKAIIKRTLSFCLVLYCRVPLCRLQIRRSGNSLRKNYHTVSAK